MKKALFLLLFFISVNAFSQCMDEITYENDSLSYLLHVFLKMDLVIGPEIYNSQNDTSLQYVIFTQDTLFGRKESSTLVHAAIDHSDKKNRIYCIGTVENYLIDDWVVGFTMKKGYSDGREEEIFYPIKFNQIPISFNMDYDYATYGVNVNIYWAYGDGMCD